MDLISLVRFFSLCAPVAWNHIEEEVIILEILSEVVVALRADISSKTQFVLVLMSLHRLHLIPNYEHLKELQN